MAFYPVVLPPETPDPIQQLIRRAIDPFLADAHVMLRLPFPSAGLDAGCGFSIAQVLLSVVSGASVLLYSGDGHSGVLFRDFLADYYPWDLEPEKDGLAVRSEAVKILWDEYRNPFAHAMGVSVREKGLKRKLVPRNYAVKVLRITETESHAATERGLSEARIEEMEQMRERPGWLPPTVISQAHKRVLSVESFYWGVRSTIANVCSDQARMQAAARFLEEARFKPA